MKQKCAFFDFDYTIAHGDSINKLLNYTLKKYPLSVFRFLPLIPYGEYSISGKPNSRMPPKFLASLTPYL